MKLVAGGMKSAQCSSTTACYLTVHGATVHTTRPALTTPTQSNISNVTYVKLDQFTRRSHQFNSCVEC